MRGSLEAGELLFNIETDAEHIRAWVVSESGQRLAGAVFENDRDNDGCLVAGTWDAGQPVALVAFSCATAAVFLNDADWFAGLWKVCVQAGTPQRALIAGVEEARVRFQPPRLAEADLPGRPLSGEAIPWGRTG